MSDDRYLELAPLAALGALDGEDRTGFDVHLPGCPACRRELEAFGGLVARLPLGLEPVPPRSALGLRVLTQAHTTVAAGSRGGWAVPALATAAAVAMAVGFVVARAERDTARRDAARAREASMQLEAELGRLRADLVTMRASLSREQGLRDLVAHPDARLAKLAALAPAPGATARVVWNPKSREAWLVASGLTPAPEGKGYEVWVIGSAAPVPAGVFQVDLEGRAFFKLPEVEETAEVKTFAVTLEPAAGTPAPTGPMVLAGAAVS
jgi:anti-sigma-K factor RskA